MSTPGPQRVPSTVKIGKTSGQGKPPAGDPKPVSGKPGAPKPRGNRPTGGKGRKPATPVKVTSSRTPIAIGILVAVVVLAIIGYAVFSVVHGSRSWEDKAADIKGIVNYRAQKNPAIDARNHKDGTLTYVTSPPVGGNHNALWQNCMGDVYTAPIANEHAVHSLEHGAVWITYKQGLPQDQVDVLKSKVQGKDFLFMSPYPDLDHNVSVQAWGYQLKVDKASDKRIDEFIKDLRLNTSLEPGAPCSNGNTATGPVTATSGQPGMPAGD